MCDDDTGILEMMELILEEYGFTVITVADSIHVLQDIRKIKPDILLLDIWMPVVSGDQVIKCLKEDSNLSQLPVLMYSASSEGATIAANSGADDYIAKPFDIDDLVSKINVLLNKTEPHIIAPVR